MVESLDSLQNLSDTNAVSIRSTNKLVNKCQQMLCSIRCISVSLTSNGESVYLFLNLWLSIWMNHAVKQAVILVSSAPAYAGPHCHPGSLSCLQILLGECHSPSGN